MPNLSSEHIMGLCATVRERGRKAREAEVADLLNPLKRRIAELEQRLFVVTKGKEGCDHSADADNGKGKGKETPPPAADTTPPPGQGAEDAPPPADTADNGQAEELPPDNAEAAQGEDAGKGEELPPDTPPPGQGALDGAPPPPAAYEDDGKKGKGKGKGNGKRGRPRK